jgi:hypothetical protein
VIIANHSQLQEEKAPSRILASAAAFSPLRLAQAGTGEFAMYDFLDRPVTSLNPGGRFLVWSMRSWVKAMSDRSCPASTLGNAFARWGMIAGLQPFLRMMAVLNRSGLETFQFCTLSCNHVSEHEAIILSLVCSLNEGRPEAVCDTLALLVEDDAIGECVASLTALGGCLEKASIFPERALRVPGPSSDHRLS